MACALTRACLLPLSVPSQSELASLREAGDRRSALTLEAARLARQVAAEAGATADVAAAAAAGVRADFWAKKRELRDAAKAHTRASADMRAATDAVAKAAAVRDELARVKASLAAARRATGAPPAAKRTWENRGRGEEL